MGQLDGQLVVSVQFEHSPAAFSGSSTYTAVDAMLKDRDKGLTVRLCRCDTE